jgi:hypothetical protein
LAIFLKFGRITAIENQIILALYIASKKKSTRLQIPRKNPKSTHIEVLSHRHPCALPPNPFWDGQGSNENNALQKSGSCAHFLTAMQSGYNVASEPPMNPPLANEPPKTICLCRF